jgi:hypothetical protein
VGKTGKTAEPSGTRNTSDNQKSRSLSGNRSQTRIRSGGINGLKRLAYLSLRAVET